MPILQQTVHVDVHVHAGKGRKAGYSNASPIETVDAFRGFYRRARPALCRSPVSWGSGAPLCSARSSRFGSKDSSTRDRSFFIMSALANFHVLKKGTSCDTLGPCLEMAPTLDKMLSAYRVETTWKRHGFLDVFPVAVARWSCRLVAGVTTEVSFAGEQLGPSRMSRGPSLGIPCR